MFGRRRREESPAVADEVEEVEQVQARESGPWDSGEPCSERERVDLGGMRLPVDPGFEVQLNLAGDHIVGAVIMVGESALQVHAFAAPKRSGIWDEVRDELAEGVKGAGGTAEEREGPFGVELAAQVPADGVAQPVRYIGVDGPRWFLRAVISGRAALDAEAAATLEGVIRDIVVVRGDEPMAPKEAIELRLPPEARQAMEQHAAGGDVPDLNPFKRGPEIAELR
ncbi:DUF3710 domain-containing protein [Streptosporangium roseum]|uniref:DUF3710 domain-containing protein n=1 Tax=Streptosporangium roseum (strain ATCC 12428 / DSM 43021 / JCM 3005 / KCTC 9067 / NCIMB 10171 / NRRL 2505 / NI 9100) TaxID=479432 RepID=D2B5G7_STRRD|nr:DUF3710 domain-containing protein [Streptosporangium roseum]ACZ89472.1 hypothetical protein Sros_6763 [Streptosporangium roseum DSM 43021]